jgi:CheY-like chemotaxis protein
MVDDHGDTLDFLQQTLTHEGPVILLTAYADVYATELAGAPFARVLRKPVDPWTLCREVRDVAQGR